MAKPITDQVPRLDIRRRAHRRPIQPGFVIPLLGPKSEESFAVLEEDERARLVCRLTWGRPPSTVAFTISVVWTPCHFGGERPWWRCPVCGRRVAVIYLRRQPACRICLGLRYRSQRLRETDRALQRARRLRRRLGGGTALFDPVTDRPKGMHAATYERLLTALRDAENLGLQGMRRRIERLLQSVARTESRVNAACRQTNVTPIKQR